MRGELSVPSTQSSEEVIVQHPERKGPHAGGSARFASLDPYLSRLQVTLDFCLIFAQDSAWAFFLDAHWTNWVKLPENGLKSC